MTCPKRNPETYGRPVKSAIERDRDIVLLKRSLFGFLGWELYKNYGKNICLNQIDDKGLHVW